MAKLVQSKQQDRNPYDATKQYSWNPDDIFEITGLQLAAFVNLIEQALSQPGGAPLNYYIRANQVITDIIKMGVEQGVMREAHEPAVRSLFEDKQADQ